MLPSYLQSIRSQVVTGFLALGILLTCSNQSLAIPPLDIEKINSVSAEVSWPDTGETVELEASDNLTLWQTFPGSPTLSGGRFRQLVSFNQEIMFFRLTESTIDPDSPVFGGVVSTNPSLFPGETVSFNLSATDPNGLPISFLAEPLPLPAGASLNMVTGEFSWTPDQTQTGITAITFLAFNGNESARLLVAFNVEEPPVDGETSLSGILLDTTDSVAGTDQPIVGAVVSLLGTDASATTGANGRFSLPNIPGGLQILDLNTANAQPAPDGSGYAGFREAITIVEGVPNDVERPFFLPRLAMDSMAQVNPNFTTMVENTAVGVSLVVPPRTAMADGEDFTGALSISEVPEALAPAALPENLGFGQLVTIQPVGVTFNRPVPITFQNIDNLPPGSETDIWSLDPDAGIFTVVGTGRVTADGQSIETIAGGVVAADWHGTLPPSLPPSGGAPPPPSPPSGGSSGGGGSGGNGAGGDGPGSPFPGCPSSSNAGAGLPFGSTVSLSDGAVLTSISLPAYRSGGVTRTFGLGYHSITACPRIIAPVETTISVRSAVPPLVSFSGTLGGIAGTAPVFVDTTGLSESIDETFVAGLSFDARGVETGFAPYTVTATSHFGRSTVSAQRTDRAVVVNRSTSAFGAGWGLLGDQQIVSFDDNDSSLLMVSGDGSSRLFRDAATFQPFTVASLGGQRASTYSFATGDLFTQARAAVTGAFPNAEFRAVESLGLASDADLLVLSPYASATQGAPLSTADQAAMMAFIGSGGCALVFLDHDLSRASLESARASLLEPFGFTGSNNNESGGAIRPITHPIGQGEFGVVDRLDTPFGGFELNTTDTDLEILVPGSSTGTARLALLPAGALGNSSGPVLFVADTNAFTDLADVGFESQPAHASLLLNNIEFCLLSQRDPGADLEFIGPAGEFSRLLKAPNGTFERRLTDGSRYNYNAAGALTGITARSGETLTFARNPVGNLTQITDSFGRQTRFIYSGDQLSQIVDPAGRTTTLTHDSAGNLISVRLPDGATTGYEYDADHLMTAEIDPDGGRTERRYDPFGRALSVTLPDGTERQVRSAQSQAADLRGTAGTESDPVPFKRASETVTQYTDGNGDLYEIELGPGGTASKVTDPTGLSLELVRNENGSPVAQSAPSGQTFSSQYDRTGRPIALTDGGSNNTYTFAYDDSLGALTAMENGQGQTATISYDANGRQTDFVSFGGRTTEFQYDGTQTIPSTLMLPGGLMTEIEQDLNGNVTSVSSGGAETTFDYSPEGYLNRLTDAEGRVFDMDYDINGNMTRMGLPGGNTVNYAYNSRGLPTTITVPSGEEYGLEFDGQGRRLLFTSPLGDDYRVAYEYTGEQLSRVSHSDGSDIRYAFSDGKIDSMASAGGTTNISYSETTGLVERVSAPGNFGIDFTYDGSGRLINSNWNGAVNGSVTRSYNPLGLLASVAVNDSPAITVGYDADNLITRSGSMDLTRDADTGSPIAATLGRCSDSWSYNTSGQLIGYTASFDDAPVYSLSLTRDQLGRVLTKDETIQGVNTQIQFGYTPAGRLATETRNGVTTTYTYDANGNRLTRSTAGGATESGAYNAGDQLTAYAGATYQYDSGGRLSQRGADAFAYDMTGGLQSAILSGGPSVTYLDPVGERRASDSVDGVMQRQFVYQGIRTLAGELDANGVARSAFGYVTLSTPTPDFIQQDGRTLRIIADELGSPRLVINCDTGEVLQRMRHDAFGRVLEDTAPRFQPYGFAGGIYDPETGFVRLGARDYDALTGRWTAPDPALFGGSVVSLYEYANGDPVNFADRNGMVASPAGCGGGGDDSDGGGGSGGGGGGSCSFNPPMFNPPVFNPPVFDPPVFDPPVFDPPIFNPPVFTPPGWTPPVFTPPTFSPPTFTPPVFTPPKWSPPVWSPPVWSPPVWNPPVWTPPSWTPPVFTPPTFSLPTFSL